MLVCLALIAASGGCSSVFDYRGYIVIDEDYDHHSHPEAKRWSQRNFDAPGGKLYVATLAYESEELWFGPIIPFFPIGVFTSPRICDTDPPQYVYVQMIIAAKNSIDLDWSNVVVKTEDGQILETFPHRNFFYAQAARGQEKYAMQCVLPPKKGPTPRLVVTIPEFLVGNVPAEIDPFTLGIEDRRHFVIGFK